MRQITCVRCLELTNSLEEEGPPNIASVVDNDVLIKFSSYDLLHHIGLVLRSPIGVLGAARFVVTSRLKKPGFLVDPSTAENCFLTFMRDSGVVIEPSDPEVELAAEIEEAALRAELPLHGGESQLCAVVAMRGLHYFATGDKSAITAAESVLPPIAACISLSGRFVCLEQLVASLGPLLGTTTLRRRVCAEAGADKALTICFECTGSPGAPFIPAGLTSYIRDLRARAPTMLSSQDLWL